VTGLSNGTAYTFGVRATNGVQYGPAGTSGSVTPAAPIGLFFGGQTSPGGVNVIDYISITSTGNATDFGDLTIPRYSAGSCSSSSRGILGGGFNQGPLFYNVIEYVTISSAGNAADFGDLLSVNYQLGSCSSSTRGIFAGGDNSVASSINVIQYITIGSLGNASDFGDLIKPWESMASFSSPTRGIFAGGAYDGNKTNLIQYITIATFGNSATFGELTVPTDAGTDNPTGCSNATRGLIFIGITSSSYSNIINYITIASEGNAADFGDLSVQSQYAGAACASSITGVIGGGANGGGNFQNVISYVTIGTLGNASDFGDLSVGRQNLASCSNVHGGL
jgi:hypothetical protein